jgi:hypothetical protein
MLQCDLNCSRVIGLLGATLLAARFRTDMESLVAELE